MSTTDERLLSYWQQPAPQIFQHLREYISLPETATNFDVLNFFRGEAERLAQDPDTHLKPVDMESYITREDCVLPLAQTCSAIAQAHQTGTFTDEAKELLRNLPDQLQLLEYFYEFQSELHADNERVAEAKVKALEHKIIQAARRGDCQKLLSFYGKNANYSHNYETLEPVPTPQEKVYPIARQQTAHRIAKDLMNPSHNIDVGAPSIIAVLQEKLRLEDWRLGHSTALDIGIIKFIQSIQDSLLGESSSIHSPKVLTLNPSAATRPVGRHTGPRGKVTPFERPQPSSQPAP